MIKLNGIKAIIWGIPFMNLTEFPNHIVTKRNQQIKLICESYGFDFIDINIMQKDACHKKEKFIVGS